MINLDRWYEHYRDRLNDRYKSYIVRKYAPFICEIAGYLTDQSFTSWNIAELGCGICSITRELYKLAPAHYYTAFDNSGGMLKLSNINTKDLYAAEQYLEFVKHDVKNVYPFKQFDLVHSHGLLEHFNDKEIYYILHHHRNAAQFHYVPSSKYTTKTMGDERLMSPNDWRKLTGMNIIEFNEGYDLIITNVK